MCVRDEQIATMIWRSTGAFASLGTAPRVVPGYLVSTMHFAGRQAARCLFSFSINMGSATQTGCSLVPRCGAPWLSQGDRTDARSAIRMDRLFPCGFNRLCA